MGSKKNKCTFATLGEENWGKLTFTKTSGTVTRDRENFDQQTGLLIGHEETIKFPGIFRHRFAEKPMDFLSKKFSALTSPKNNR